MSESATSATQNNMTTCLETFEKDRFSSFPHRLPPSLKFVNIIKQVGMSESATPATQNGRTTCVETFEKESFCGFPHRHGDATGKGETRDRARGCRKNSISYETSSNFHSWQHNKKTSFAASPIDTARPRETRDARRDRWEHQNEHFVRDLLQFSHFVASKSTFSYEFSLEPENLQPQNRCFVRGFRQFSPHRTKCHACHGICTLSPLDAALPMRFTKNTQHDTSKVLRLPRKMTTDTSKVLRLPRKMQDIL